MAELKHNESNIKVYFTREHNIFRGMKGNRFLNERKVAKMMKDIGNGLDMLRYCPIIVNKAMEVIDGQHRLHVARKLGSNVWYVIYNDEMSINSVAKINSCTERWKPADFMNCYEMQGNENYKMLHEFMDKYNIQIGTAKKILTGYNSDGGEHENEKQNFENGLFKVNDLKESEEFMAFCSLFEKYPNWNGRRFLVALAKIYKKRDKIDMTYLLEKFNDNVDMLNDCSDTKSMLKAMEEIYNIRRRKRETIF